MWAPGLLTDLAEVGQQEVGGRTGPFVPTPGVRFGADGVGDGVDGLVGFVLAFAHESVTFSGCDPLDMSGRCRARGDCSKIPSRSSSPVVHWATDRRLWLDKPIPTFHTRDMR